MKGIWKKCLGLTAGLLALSALRVAAQEPEGEVIARTPAPAVCAVDQATQHRLAQEAQQQALAASRAVTVSLGRPRTVTTPVEQAAFRQPVFRAQVSEPAPMPSAPTSNPELLAPPPRSVLPTPSYVDTAAPPPGVVRMPVGAVPGGIVSHGPIGPDGVTEFASDAPGFDSDRFAHGDGVSHLFTNLAFVDVDYLMWSMNGTRIPPLLVSNGTLLIGDNEETTGHHPGGRVRAGFWFDRDHSIGLEGSYFFLTQGSTRTTQMSPGSVPLAVPLFLTSGQATSLPIAGLGLPGMATESLTNRLWGAEANVRGNLFACPNWHLDLIGGFRVVGFDENFAFSTGTDLGTRGLLSTADTIDVRNRFWGGQIGFDAEGRWRRMSLGVTGKLALGGTNEVIRTGGATRLGAAANNSGIFIGGLALGRYSRNEFAIMPELGIKVGYQLTDCLRATIGYNLLYLSKVVRPGEQLDRTIGPGHPILPFQSSDLWVTGLTAGLEFRY